MTMACDSSIFISMSKLHLKANTHLFVEAILYIFIEKILTKYWLCVKKKYFFSVTTPRLLLFDFFTIYIFGDDKQTN